MKRTFLVALGLSACVAHSRVIGLELEQFQNRPQNQRLAYRQRQDEKRNEERLFQEKRGRNEEETSVEERQNLKYDQVHRYQDHQGGFQEEQVFVLGNRKIIVTIRQEDNKGGITVKNHEKRSNGRNQRNNDEFERNSQKKVGKQNLGRQGNRNEGNFENERYQEEFRSSDNERNQRGSEERFGLQRERNQGGLRKNQNQDDQRLRSDFSRNQQDKSGNDRNQMKQRGQQNHIGFKDQEKNEQGVLQSNKSDQQSGGWNRIEPRHQSDSLSTGTQFSDHQSAQTKEVSSKTLQSVSQTSSQSINQNQTSTKSDQTQTKGEKTQNPTKNISGRDGNHQTRWGYASERNFGNQKADDDQWGFVVLDSAGRFERINVRDGTQGQDQSLRNQASQNQQKEWQDKGNSHTSVSNQNQASSISQTSSTASTSTSKTEQAQANPVISEQQKKRPAQSTPTLPSSTDSSQTVSTSTIPPQDQSTKPTQHS